MIQFSLLKGITGMQMGAKANIALSKNVYDWYSKNKLLLNYQKSIFNKANSSHNIVMRLHSHRCDMKKETEYCRINCRQY